MKIVFAKGHTLFSKMIMWGLSEPVSHLAIVFDNMIVFHSDLAGVRLAWYPTFLESHDIVETIEFDLTPEQEEEVYQSVITRFDGKGYDYSAFLYFGWRAALKKAFNTPMPSSNPWGSKDRFLCDEIVEVLPDYIVPQAIKQLDLSITSPWEVYLKFKELGLLGPQAPAQ